MKYATKIIVCVIAVSKAQEFFIESSSTFYIFFDFDDKSMFLTTSYTSRDSAGETCLKLHCFSPVQLMSLQTIISCFIKIQNGVTFMLPAYRSG